MKYIHIYFGLEWVNATKRVSAMIRDLEVSTTFGPEIHGFDHIPKRSLEKELGPTLELMFRRAEAVFVQYDPLGSTGVAVYPFSEGVPKLLPIEIEPLFPTIP